jgi:hypothetical protein
VIELSLLASDRVSSVKQLTAVHAGPADSRSPSTRKPRTAMDVASVTKPSPLFALLEPDFERSDDAKLVARGHVRLRIVEAAA